MLLSTKIVAFLTLILMVCATVLLGGSVFLWCKLYQSPSIDSEHLSQLASSWMPSSLNVNKFESTVTQPSQSDSSIAIPMAGITHHAQQQTLFHWALGSGILGLLSLSSAFATLLLYLRLNHKDIKRFEHYVYGMTHELKNPITTIGLTCNMLSEAGANQASHSSQARYLQIIERENLRLKKLVERVLNNASPLFSGLKFNLQKQTVDLVQIVQLARESVEPHIERTHAQIEVQSNQDHIELSVDPHHFTNVLINLLDNALKYTENRPYLCIMLTAGTSQVSISVQDNGIGMTTSEMRQVFQPYYRTATTRHLEIHGFGLGLSYVRAVVQAHQGTIELYSEVRKGTRIVIHLPK